MDRSGKWGGSGRRRIECFPRTDETAMLYELVYCRDGRFVFLQSIFLSIFFVPQPPHVTELPDT
jgi:hypothetical protein